MMSFVITFISVFGGLLLLIFVFRMFAKTIQSKQSNSNNLTVIIPLRNEASNLEVLLSSLEDQKQLESEIIFIDDHSTDQSLEMIQSWAKNKESVRVLQLPDKLQGKKQAISFGVESSARDYCLTLDADTWMGNDFFEELKIPSQTDIQIRPVIMKGRNLIGKFASTEYTLFNALNYLFAPIYQMSASGANLIFRKLTYLKSGNLENHIHIPSGDDHFLLRNFQRAKANIDITNQIQDAVYTNAPKNLKEYLNQRIRWLSKTTQKTSIQELLIGVLITLYLIGSFILLLWLLLRGDFELAILLFLFRVIADSIVFLIYTNSLKVASQVISLPIFQIIYPIFFTIILIGSIVYKPKWKGIRT
jgi:biofilm PGA synthesis N-glycosyltransferase PgaC